MLVPHHSHHNCHSSRGPQRLDLLLVMHHTKLFFSLQFKEFWLTAQPTVSAEQGHSAVLTSTKPTSQVVTAPWHTRCCSPFPMHSQAVSGVCAGWNKNIFACCTLQKAECKNCIHKCKGLGSDQFQQSQDPKRTLKEQKGTVPKIQCSSSWKTSADSVHDQCGFISHLLPREI